MTMELHSTLLYEESAKLPEIFTPDEVDAIFRTVKFTTKRYRKALWGDWLRTRDLAILAMMYYHALRPKECLAIRFDDINVQKGNFKIRGENNKQRKERFMPILPQAIPYLKAYLKFSRFYFWRGSSYLFPSYEQDKGQGHLSPCTWKATFRNILKDSGLWLPPVKKGSSVPPRRSYTLRATRATEWLEKTGNPVAVANALGHADLRSLKTLLGCFSQVYRRNEGNLKC